MSEFTVRSDHVDVEDIMRQIRARVREKRGVDYTEQELHELASVRLEQFLDPQSVRSELLKAYRERQDMPPNYAFDADTLYASSRGSVGGVLLFIRRLLNPVLKLFFNPNVVSHVLHLQSRMNDHFLQRDPLHFELFHNIVVELTRLGVENRNLKMRIESIQSRLDFHERRARALEGVVEYRAGASSKEDEGTEAEAEGERGSRRRRRRRGRKRPPGPNQESGIGNRESGIGGREEPPGERTAPTATPSAGERPDDSSTSET
ncbi:MAG: hypothetical protein GEU99_12455 [Luteitalea sp.]|nr:hypothetical protein [Luteitalea sp.]